MKQIFLSLLLTVFVFSSAFSQNKENQGIRILFQGVVMDANTLTPIDNTHILVNRFFTSVSGKDGAFALYVTTNDTLVFESLGYKPATMFVSDTLVGREYVAGIYMKSDTLSIGEVVIVPRSTNLRSDIMNSKSKVPSTMDNARYNVAVSAYQGKTTRGKLGDPASNYQVLKDKQRVDAYQKGEIPSDRIFGLNPFLIIPGAYFLIHGLPEQAPALQPDISNYELEQIQKKYLESLKPKK